MLRDNRLRRKDHKENEASFNNLQIQQQFMVRPTNYNILKMTTMTFNQKMPSVGEPKIGAKVQGKV